MIYEDDSGIKLDGVELPGVLKSIEVEGDALIDAATVEGSKKKPKQSIGYDDKKIYIELILGDGPGALTAADKLERLEKLYQAAGQQKPAVMEIISEHTARRGISRVLWKNLTTKASNKDDLIIASLELWEDVPLTLTAASAKRKAAAAPPGGVSEDYAAYITTGRGAVRQTRGSNKKGPETITAKSPVAKDPAPNAFAYRDALKRLGGGGAR